VLAPEDWKAQWITAPGMEGGISKTLGYDASEGSKSGKFPSLLLRREFPVKSGLLRAVVHVSGLGQYEMFINGSKVGDHLIAPGWTNYKKTVLYDSYDVTAMLRAGANATGISLGNGMYHIPGGRYTKIKQSFGPLKAIAQIRLEYADGSVDRIGTDTTWQAAPGPITFSCVYGGEDYDARLEKSDWNRAGLRTPDAPNWTAAEPTNGPGGELKGLSAAAAPIKAIATLKPAAPRELSAGVLVYDFGQNTSLMPRLAVSGPAGSSVRMIPSELVRENGDIEDTMCNGNNWWQYTLKGTGAETWFPQFYYRGARYLKVVLTPAPGDPALPKIAALEGVIVHSSASPVGEFATSNALFNRIFPLIRWAQRSNLVSIITDCPTREKLGWLEQYHLNGPALRYNYDLAAIFTKGMRDMQDSQAANGMIPTVAPDYLGGGGDFHDSPEWGAAFVLSAWQQYEFHGDVAMLRDHYEAMQRYAAYLSGRAKDGIIDFGLGDWYDLGPRPPGKAQLTPRSLTGTAIYYEEIRAMSRIATILGKTADTGRYAAQATDIGTAFNRKFFNAGTKQYATGSQCSNAMPLVLGLVPAEHRSAVVENLVQDVQAKGPTAGDVGYRYLLRSLSDSGRSDVIFTMNNQSDKPGYGMQLARGATALTEAWNGLRASSQNHFMLGQINEWFYHDLAGIQCDPAGPGFRKIIIHPAIVGDLTEVSASYDSVSGKITSAWKRTDRQLGLSVVIPPNTTATVYVPADNPSLVTEHGRPAAQSPGIKFLRNEPGCAVFTVGSGTYSFLTTLPRKSILPS
ncbi:MAG: family 78 glycoside hydrolase catalytic domain, partial [Luteolibacter sp.]